MLHILYLSLKSASTQFVYLLSILKILPLLQKLILQSNREESSISKLWFFSNIYAWKKLTVITAIIIIILLVIHPEDQHAMPQTENCVPPPCIDKTD
jgi:hypothetical protein